MTVYTGVSLILTLFTFVCRWLLAPGSHCLLDSKQRGLGSCCPSWPKLWGKLRWHLSLWGTAQVQLHHSSGTYCFDFTHCVFSLVLSSGSLVNGWMWWLMTVCLPETESCCLSTRQRVQSFGVHCWRRPTPSMEGKNIWIPSVCYSVLYSSLAFHELVFPLG